jgi:hypothetical protein
MRQNLGKNKRLRHKARFFLNHVYDVPESA